MASARTITSLVRDALRFYNEHTSGGIFIGLGQEVPWADETNPPAPDMTATSIDAIAYKRISEVKLVVPESDPNAVGELITWRGGTYRVVSPENAMALGAHWVYLRADLVETELRPCTFRQLGVFTGLQRAFGVPLNKSLLYAVEVANPGYLEMIENRRAISHADDTSETIQYIREF